MPGKSSRASLSGKYGNLSCVLSDEVNILCAVASEALGVQPGRNDDTCLYASQSELPDHLPRPIVRGISEAERQVYAPTLLPRNQLRH